MILYEIETKTDAYNMTGVLEFEYKYRYVSLYNGARGLWFDTIEEAEKQGEKHQEIIEMIHNAAPMCVIKSDDFKWTK